MDFRHLIVTCLFSMLRLPFDNQKVKENYAIFYRKVHAFHFFIAYFCNLKKQKFGCTQIIFFIIFIWS